MSAARKFTKEELTQEAWKRGNLAYKLYDYQVVLYEALWKAITNPSCVKYVLKCSRRWGKSTLLCLIAIEFCLRKPGAQLRFTAPTAKALKKITLPIFRMLCKDAPDQFKPVYKTMEQMWLFPNGSEIHMAGTDNGNAESLRGTASDLNLIDEAGFATDLDYVLRDILMPQTLTTGGKTLLASSPARTPAHDFTEISRECEVDGYFQKFTIYDNPSISQATRDLYAKESGGYESTTWLREYECKDVVDESLAIIPEWKDEYIKEIPRDEYYGYYHKYVGMDLGRIDQTALVLGPWLFRDATLYIEDEIIMEGTTWTTETLKSELLKKEKELWGEQKPFRRISDNNNPHLINDLSSLYNVWFMQTDKDALEAMVNAVRELVARGQLIVHPRCTNLIGCLRWGVWDQKRKGFDRSKKLGHFDALAALIYLVRNLARNSNPIPVTHGHENHRSWLGNVKGQMNTSNNARVISQAIMPKFNKPIK